jgi:hypothetical protein
MLIVHVNVHFFYNETYESFFVKNYQNKRKKDYLFSRAIFPIFLGKNTFET